MTEKSMNDKECQEIQRRLTAGEALDVAGRMHLRNCPECRAVANLCQLLSPEASVEKDTPDEAFERRVQEACHRELRLLALRRRMKVASRTLTAAAAAVILFLGVTLAVYRRAPLQEDSERLAVNRETAVAGTSEELVSAAVVLDASVLLMAEELDDVNTELAIALASADWEP